MMSLVPRSYMHNSPVDLYNMLDDFFNTPANATVAGGFKMDVSENDSAYTVEADLPGVSKDDIDIEHNGDTLTIGVDYKDEDDEKNENGDYVYRERKHVSMKRSVVLKDGDEDAIQAKYENGVLTVTVPKKQRNDGARKIAID
jgi:HSP20 family protein